MKQEKGGTMEKSLSTDRTRLRRLPDRGSHDRDAIHRILDEALVCHVGFEAEGQPYVIPTLYGRVGDHLYLHGSAASRMLGRLEKGIPVCVTVTLLDGLVLARSAFHHSVNYRSVVVLGRAELVASEGEKLLALRAISEHVVPGRWAEVREPNEREMRVTSVLRIPLLEASAKVRVGPPKDDEEDLSIPVWAGVLPLETLPGEPVPDETVKQTAPVPGYVRGYRRPR